MKNLAFFSSLLLAAMFVLVSCGKDDPTPSSGQETVAYDIPFDVYVAANATTTIPSDPTTKLLSSVLSSTNQDKVKYVKSSAINRRDSYLSVTGLTDGSVLKNITFSTSDKKISFPLPVTSISRDTTFFDDAYTDLAKQVSDYMASNKSVALTASYTAGDNNIGAGVIKLHIAATYSW